MVQFCEPVVVVAYRSATPHSVMLLEAAVVTVFAGFSCIVKFCRVIQLAPTSLKIPSFKQPTQRLPFAVIVLALP